MSKKDLLERISRTNSGPVVRRAAEGTTRVATTPGAADVTTRVSRRVVRRRKKGDEEGSDSVVTVRRRKAEVAPEEAPVEQVAEAAPEPHPCNRGCSIRAGKLWTTGGGAYDRRVELQHAPRLPQRR